MTITILRGASGSGKSTYARSLKDTLIISRDIIRQSFGATGKTLLATAQEREVTNIEIDMLRRALVTGRDAVIDDTNLNPDFCGKFIDECHIYGVEPEIVEFWEPLEVLLARRTEVPEEVVRRQFKQGFKPPRVRVPLIEPVATNGHFPYAFVFDIDGTLAHVNPYNPRDVYDGSRVREDLLDVPVARVLGALMRDDYEILIVSGRSEEYRWVTEKWLEDYDIPYAELRMRPEGDTRHDVVIKYEIIQDLTNEYNVFGVFDDRTRVTTAYRTMGLKTFHVEDWIKSDF